jgi:hypothetical protein
MRSSTEYESPLGIRGDGGNDKEAALIAKKQLIIMRVNNRWLIVCIQLMNAHASNLEYAIQTSANND